MDRKPDDGTAARPTRRPIAHALVWYHERRLLRVAREEQLRVAREERDAIALLDGGDVDDVDGLDDVAASDDYAELDAMAGYGVEPWADEQYGPDPDDDFDGGLGPDTEDLDGVWDEFDDLDDRGSRCRPTCH